MNLFSELTVNKQLFLYDIPLTCNCIFKVLLQIYAIFYFLLANKMIGAFFLLLRNSLNQILSCWIKAVLFRVQCSIYLILRINFIICAMLWNCLEFHSLSRIDLVKLYTKWTDCGREIKYIYATIHFIYKTPHFVSNAVQILAQARAPERWYCEMAKESST